MLAQGLLWLLESSTGALSGGEYSQAIETLQVAFRLRSYHTARQAISSKTERAGPDAHKTPLVVNRRWQASQKTLAAHVKNSLNFHPWLHNIPPAGASSARLPVVLTSLPYRFPPQSLPPRHFCRAFTLPQLIASHSTLRPPGHSRVAGCRPIVRLLPVH